MKRLKRGELVLMFPEGTRTPDGELQQIKSGFTTIARRTKVALVPCAVMGFLRCLAEAQEAAKGRRGHSTLVLVIRFTRTICRLV